MRTLLVVWAAMSGTLVLLIGWIAEHDGLAVIEPREQTQLGRGLIEAQPTLSFVFHDPTGHWPS
jgi:hypothetical protein